MCVVYMYYTSWEYMYLAFHTELTNSKLINLTKIYTNSSSLSYKIPHIELSY